MLKGISNRPSGRKYLRVLLLVALTLSLLFLYFGVLQQQQQPLLQDKRPSHEPILDPVQNVSAAFVILIRNSDLPTWLPTMRQLEERFNRNFRYPYVFLNDVPFTEEFKNAVKAVANGKVEFGLTTPESWSYPTWISKDMAAKTRERMKDIIYGSSESYRFMCRFESGYFFRHPLVMKYEYYWRVEPGVSFFCDIRYDPFLWMKRRKKKYSFIISLYEYMETIPTLWDSVKKFIKRYPQYVKSNNALNWISDDSGKTYNGCHFWSNFEIGDLNFFRSEPYEKFFDYLDHEGGFFYERWGDAPVHSIAASLFLEPEEIHFFDDFGYEHDPFSHCPRDAEIRNCSCQAASSFDRDPYSCTAGWFDLFDYGKPTAGLSFY